MGNQYIYHIYERSQNTILLASTQVVYKAPHSTVRGIGIRTRHSHMSRDNTMHGVVKVTR